jgi:itaconate CoA-transferase
VTGPLAGVTVIALEQAVSAPMCTRTLADFGARVIKVENPAGGDFARHYRGKESVTLDLKSTAGMDVLHRLLDDADVLVSNLAPGATARLGLAPADLAQTHPELISVEIDGYGSGGPLSHKRAYDLLIQAESGTCAVTGSPGAPAKPGPAVADVSSGLYAALSILALLCGRARRPERRTEPAAVSVSLFDTMAEVMGYQLTYTRHTGIDQSPLGMSAPAVAPYGAYRTGDAQTVVLGTTNDREWLRFARDVIGRQDLADDARYATNSDRVVNREILDEAIGSWCAQLNLADIQRAADEAGIGNARYNVPSEVLRHPQLSERGRWREIETPCGPTLAVLPPPIISGYDPPMGAVPGLGAHTDAVLAETGFSAQEIAGLRDQGVIGPGP